MSIKFFSKYPKELVSLFFIIVVTIFSYWPVFLSFFQQDEWLSFAHHSALKALGVQALLKDSFIPTAGHYQPFNTLIIHGLYSVFELNYLAYTVISIGLHLITVSLVFILTKKIFHNLSLAFFSTLFFGVAVAGFQATSWVLADISIHLASIFAIISIIFFFDFVEQGKSYYVKYSLIFLIISLLFKEIAIGLFLLFPVMVILFGEKNLKKERGRRQVFKTLLIVALFYVFIRSLVFFLPQPRNDVSVTASQSYGNMLFNIATLPFQGITQTIVPITFLLNVSDLLGNLLPETITGVKNTTEYDVFIEKKIFGGVSLGISVLVILFSLFMFRKEKVYGKLLIFSIVLIMLNMPVYALAPEKSGKAFIVDSRNLYFVLIGTSILLVSMAKSLFTNKVYLSLFLSLMIIMNIYFLNSQLKHISDTGLLRKQILQTIKQDYPLLPQKVIFFTESDSSFYGLPESEHILPFQSGFGQNLIMWYHPSEHFPIDFLQNKYLWEITSQGYKESAGRGFGYYRDFKAFSEAVRRNNITAESIIAYSYNSKTNYFRDISKDVRRKLMGETDI